MKSEKKCADCGHTHNPRERCCASFCVECGLTGDLRDMTCKAHKELTPKLEQMIKVMQKTGQDSITWKDLRREMKK